MAAEYKIIKEQEHFRRIATDIISYVLAGAKALLAGELEGENPPFPVPAKLYSAENISFLYNEEEHKL